MSPSLLPALAPLPLAAPAPPGQAPGSGAVPGNDFAQELSQARSAKTDAAPAPAPASAPAAQRPDAPKADEGRPRTQGPADESSSAKALRQWLAQNAAARRSAAQGKPAPKAEADPAATADAAARTDRRDAKAQRKANAADGIEDAVAVAVGPGTTPPVPRPDSETLDATAALGAGLDDPALPGRTGAEAPPSLAALPMPVAGPLASGAAAAALPSAVSMVAQDDPALRPAVDRAELTRPALPPTGDDLAPMSDDLDSDAARIDAGSASSSPTGSSAVGMTDARRGITSLPVMGAPHESGQEASSSENEGEGFQALLARQLEAPTVSMPQAVPLPSMARSDSLTPPTATPAEVPVPTAFGTPEWAQNVGHQISLLAIDGVDNARLHLHPAEMGPITVQITIEGMTAQVHLSVDNAETRQALEQAMPNLASSLRENGLTLTGGGVSEQSRQPAQDPEAGRRAGSARTTDQTANTALGGEPAAAPRMARMQGVVDLYA